MFQQCLKVLQKPKILDFVHALSWYTRQLEMKFEKIEEARLKAIRREEERLERIRLAQERQAIQEEFRRKRKEQQEQREARIRQFLAEEEAKKTKKWGAKTETNPKVKFSGKFGTTKCHPSRETIDFRFRKTT
jgi:hypothetical protein